MFCMPRRDFLRAGGAAAASLAIGARADAAAAGPADLILVNARVTTLDPKTPTASAIGMQGGRFVAVGDEKHVKAHARDATKVIKVIDVGGRTVIPGLNDSHLHLIRGGLNYNMELRWDGVPSLADAMRMLEAQAARTPPPQWVRVVGGWSEFQFVERRMPSLREINAAAPDTPVFVLHLYDRAMLNGAALRACGYTKDTPSPPGGEIERDKQGNPTGLLVARPNAAILYSTLAKGPKLPPEHQTNSTRQFMREMNRLGITSAIDAGGGYQNYPDDYRIIEDLHARGEMTVRVAYNLFTQHPKEEYEDFSKWVKVTAPGKGSDFYRMNGAGEMLVFSAADFEDFLEARPNLPSSMEQELTKVVRLLAEKRWPFRLHATYDESITRFLNVFEAVSREIPFAGLRWFFDHAETISDKNIDRVKALDGGIAIQHRMAYQGEYFINRYGRDRAARTPPITRMLEAGLPVGAGTDGTRVASYNPWMSLYWLATGKTVGGTSLYSKSNRLDRTEALRRYTVGSAWFSGEEAKKGKIAPGQLADLAVLTADYFTVPDEAIKGIESVLTIVDGKVVYGTGEFAAAAPPPLPVLPEWAPTKMFDGYRQARQQQPARATLCRSDVHRMLNQGSPSGELLWGLGCDCFAF